MQSNKVYRIKPYSSFYLFFLNKWKKKALPCILSTPCQNGAACANNNLGGYTCTCTAGYTGVNCQYGILKNYYFLIVNFT